MGWWCTLGVRRLVNEKEDKSLAAMCRERSSSKKNRRKGGIECLVHLTFYTSEA